MAALSQPRYPPQGGCQPPSTTHKVLTLLPSYVTATPSSGSLGLAHQLLLERRAITGALEWRASHVEVVTRSLFVYSLGTIASLPSPSLASVDILIHLKTLYHAGIPAPNPGNHFPSV